jgi:hypothetical protein
VSHLGMPTTHRRHVITETDGASCVSRTGRVFVLDASVLIGHFEPAAGDTAEQHSAAIATFDDTLAARARDLGLTIATT